MSEASEPQKHEVDTPPPVVVLETLEDFGREAVERYRVFRNCDKVWRDAIAQIDGIPDGDEKREDEVRHLVFLTWSARHGAADSIRKLLAEWERRRNKVPARVRLLKDVDDVGEEGDVFEVTSATRCSNRIYVNICKHGRTIERYVHRDRGECEVIAWKEKP